MRRSLINLLTALPLLLFVAVVPLWERSYKAYRYASLYRVDRDAPGLKCKTFGISCSDGGARFEVSRSSGPAERLDGLSGEECGKGWVIRRGAQPTPPTFGVTAMFRWEPRYQSTGVAPAPGSG